MQKGIPQVMDVSSIKSILHHLSGNLLPSKFEAAQQPDSNTIQLCFRSVNKVIWIEVSWQADCARIIEIERPEKVGTESTLSKQIKYGLKYMALVSIKQENFERVIKFSFAKKPGDNTIKYLIFELMGKHSNIFYVDKNYKIIAAGKQIKSSQSSFRTISTGSIYSEPPKIFKKEPDEKESYESWKKSISSISQPLKYCLINNYQGISLILTTQIEVLSDLQSKDIMNVNIELISEDNLKKIYLSWLIWIKRFKSNQFNFSTFNNFFYCVWFVNSEVKNSKEINLAKGLADYYDHFLNLKQVELIYENTVKLIYRLRKIENKNYDNQVILLINSENYQSYKDKADVIFLNPNLKKQDILEAQKLYKKSKKLKRAINLIKDRKNIYKNKLERLDEFNALLENTNSLRIETLKSKINMLKELREEICSEFNIKLKKLRVQKKIKSLSNSLPMEIKTPKGLIIQIGRNMRQNELVSFKFSKKGDIWFHAQEAPGSHVVLKSSAKVAHDEDIQIAADVAALFSSAKGNIRVPVNQVKVKDLQKISQGGPGCVTYKNVQILWGNPTRGKEYIKKDITN